MKSWLLTMQKTSTQVIYQVMSAYSNILNIYYIFSSISLGFCQENVTKSGGLTYTWIHKFSNVTFFIFKSKIWGLTYIWGWLILEYIPYVYRNCSNSSRPRFEAALKLKPNISVFEKNSSRLRVITTALIQTIM
jgi:hypothetical protein